MRQRATKLGPTSIHVSSISGNENIQDADEQVNYYPPHVVEDLRKEIVTLKQWKAKANQEIVDRDRALAELEHELVKQQSEFDANNEECMGHQRVIQELKSQLDQVSSLLADISFVVCSQKHQSHVQDRLSGQYLSTISSFRPFTIGVFV